MRSKTEELDYYFNLFDEFYAKRISFALRAASINEDQKRYEHRKNLCTIYIEFISEKLNRLKAEL